MSEILQTASPFAIFMAGAICQAALTILLIWRFPKRKAKKAGQTNGRPVLLFVGDTEIRPDSETVFTVSFECAAPRHVTQLHPEGVAEQIRDG